MHINTTIIKLIVALWVAFFTIGLVDHRNTLRKTDPKASLWDAWLDVYNEQKGNTCKGCHKTPKVGWANDDLCILCWELEYFEARINKYADNFMKDEVIFGRFGNDGEFIPLESDKDN